MCLFICIAVNEFNTVFVVKYIQNVALPFEYFLHRHFPPFQYFTRVWTICSWTFRNYLNDFARSPFA